MRLKYNVLSIIFSVIGLIYSMSLFSGTLSAGNNPEFYAYYTHLKTDEPFEKYSRTTEYADIIVNIRKGERLVFWRGTSFLPYWETLKGKWPVEEVISRKGDGTKIMPDANNMFSTIKLIENSPSKVVVLWRYLPEFEMNRYPHYPINADPLSFVEELFTVTADGNVRREIKKGTSKTDDWNNLLNKSIQTFTLSPTGISNVDTNFQKGLVKTDMVTGNKIITASVEKPVLSFTFDEGIGDQTIESISKTACPISGHKSLWKKGVSGTSLQFDGYTSTIILPLSKAPLISNGLTIEAWISLATYPWNWVPILQQGDSTGYALGMNENGEPTFQVQIGPKIFILTSKTHLERYTWYYLAGSFDIVKGKIFVYINGIQTDSLAVPKNSIMPPRKEIRVGNSKIKRRASDPCRPQMNFPTGFAFDGLLDEIRVYNKTLKNNQILNSYRNFNPGGKYAKSPDMEIRHLPEPVSNGKFQGYYTNLKYYEAWDNMWRFGNSADVVVEFDDSPTKFIFWKGTNYVPCIANDKNQWYSNEFNEIISTGGGKGCQEPMSDKNLLTTHARIVEQSDARVVVNWRVALVDTKMNIQANYDTLSGWGDWTDWYYYIYPDGVAVKRMRLWTSGKPTHEWQEGMVIIGENTRPEEVIEQSPVYYFVNDSGVTSAYNWSDAFKQKINYNDKKIFVLNLKSEWDPYSICNITNGDVGWFSKEISSYSVFCNWNHWPTALIKCDGRYTTYPDRISHSSLNHLFWNEYSNRTRDPAPYVEKLLMEGMSNKKAEALFPLSCSWLSPAKIALISGIKSAGYDASQRAYVINKQADKMSFNIMAGKQSPIVNLCFVVANWNSDHKASVKINGIELGQDKDLRQGVIRNTEGKQSLVVWIDLKTVSPITADISVMKP